MISNIFNIYVIDISLNSYKPCCQKLLFAWKVFWSENIPIFTKLLRVTGTAVFLRPTFLAPFNPLWLLLPFLTFIPNFVTYWAAIELWGFPAGSNGKESACNTGDTRSIPGLGRFPGERNGNPLQYSDPENPMDREAWQSTVPRVTELDVTEWLTLSFSLVHRTLICFLYSQPQFPDLHVILTLVLKEVRRMNAEWCV